MTIQTQTQINATDDRLAAIAAWYRAQYDAGGIPGDPKHWLTQLCYDLEQSGVYTTGIESDRKRRGSSINIRCTASATARGLAILQVREATFCPNRYTRTRKDYYLIGRNEDGSPFAHPLTGIVTARTSVAAASAKIWDCDPRDLPDIERQGDVAFVPVRRQPAELERITDDVILRNSHRLRGEVYRASNGTYYVRGQAWIVHLRREHATIKTGSSGWRRVQLAERGSAYSFSAPTAD